jgi:hypothetical protein
MGEDSTFDSLNSLRKHTPEPYELMIWNNGGDWALYETLQDWSDNVINCTKNHGFNEAVGYALMMAPTDYVGVATAGMEFSEGYMEKMMLPFEDPSVGIVGEYQGHVETYVECGETNIPEGFDIYRKSLVNHLGGLCPSFIVWGTSTFEFKLRALRHGWKVIGTPKLTKHINVEGQGKDTLPIDTLTRIRFHNNIVLKVIEGMGFNYKWWRNDLRHIATTEQKSFEVNEVIR